MPCALTLCVRALLLCEWEFCFYFLFACIYLFVKCFVFFIFLFLRQCFAVLCVHVFVCVMQNRVVCSHVVCALICEWELCLCGEFIFL